MVSRSSLIVALLFCALTPATGKEVDPWRFTAVDPVAAGPDFALVGEYRGEAADGRIIAARVGALGGGALRLALYEGGLPGESGWQRRVEPPDPRTKQRKLPDMTQEVYGRERDGVIVFDCTAGYPVVATLADGTITGRNEHGTVDLSRREGGDLPAPAGSYAGTTARWNAKKGALSLARVTPAGVGCWRLVIASGDTPEALAGAEADVAEAIARSEGIELFGWRDGEGADFPIATGPAWHASMVAGEVRGSTDGGVAFRLQRVERVSPSMGAEPPPAAVVLFDGTSADAWEVGHKVREPVVEHRGERVLVPCGRTKATFENHDLHLEYVVAFQPWYRKWYRGNSGVFVLGRTEVTIGDSFGWRTDNERWACGGLFLHRSPLVNACLPPLTWQTLDIEIRLPEGAKDPLITVRHNGVLTVDAQPAKATAHAIDKDSSDGGPLYLERPQGDIVFFRNIWVVER